MHLLLSLLAITAVVFKSQQAAGRLGRQGRQVCVAEGLAGLALHLLPLAICFNGFFPVLSLLWGKCSREHIVQAGRGLGARAAHAWNARCGWCRPSSTQHFSHQGPHRIHEARQAAASTPAASATAREHLQWAGGEIQERAKGEEGWVGWKLTGTSLISLQQKGPVGTPLPITPIMPPPHDLESMGTFGLR